MNRTQRTALWIAKRLPNVLVKEPERLFICACSIFLGLMILLYLHSTNNWIDITYIVWGSGFILGGLAKGYALILSTHPSYMRSMSVVQTSKAFERLGASLIGICCTVYALRSYSRGESIFVIFIFASLASTNLIRLVVSVAGFAPLAVWRRGE